MFGKRKLLRGTVFEREKLLKAVEELKAWRDVIDKRLTDVETKARERGMNRDTSENLTIAIKAMEAILYDL